MANPFFKITNDPLWLNADGIPDGVSARRPVSAGRDGAPGVVRRADYAVSFSAGMAINVSGGEAFVRGGDITRQGMYYCYESQTTRSITVNAAPASGTFRIDQVILRVFDDAHDASGLSEGRVEVIEGVPQATADLNQNRDAAATNLSTLASPPSKSYILLADILVTGGASALSSGVIRDRRTYCTEGGVSILASTIDSLTERVSPRPHPAIPFGPRSIVINNYANAQSAALVWLDREILAATKLIFHYRQDNPASGAANYMCAVCDASGRVIFNQNSIALNTSTNVRVHNVMTMPATNFYPGYYWYVFGIGAGTSTVAWYFTGMSADINEGGSGSRGNAVQAANVFLESTTGGATFPASKTILGYTDAADVSGNAVPVPLYEIGK